MKILCIDDRPDELKRAKVAVKKAGHTCVEFLAGTGFLGPALEQMKKADAVITDLFFNSVRQTHPAWQTEGNEPPAGLLIMILALEWKKPVALCTAMDSDLNRGEPGKTFHHGKAYGWIYDGLRPYTLQLAPKKDWEYAVSLVIPKTKKPR